MDHQRTHLVNDIDARMALMERHAQRVGESDADYLARLDVLAAWVISGKQPEVIATTRSRHICDYPACSERGSGHPLACGCISGTAKPPTTETT